MADRLRLLVIDDDIGVCASVQDAADHLGFDAKSVSDPGKVDEVYRTFQPAIILLDLVMPKRDGIEILRFLAAEGCEALIAMMSGHGQPIIDNAVRLGEALGLNLAEPLRKPFRLADLRSTLKKVA